jgi:hypothetical protein
MDEQGYQEFLSAEGVADWVVLHGVTVLLVKGRSYAQPDPRAFADAILRRE